MSKKEQTQAYLIAVRVFAGINRTKVVIVKASCRVVGIWIYSVSAGVFRNTFFPVMSIYILSIVSTCHQDVNNIVIINLSPPEFVSQQVGS